MPTDPSLERPRRPRAQDDLDDVPGLPMPDGDHQGDEALLDLDDDDAEADPEGTWLDDTADSGHLESEGIDDLEGESSALDDAYLAIDDDPLELDPETRWTDGSEAESALPVDELEGADAPPLGVDDGAEGIAEDRDPSELDEGPSSLGSDDLASDLTVGDPLPALATEDDAEAVDEPALALSALDGELVLVHAEALRVGRARLPIALEEGDALAGAVALDDARLLLFTRERRGYVFEVHGEELLPLEGRIVDAAPDRRGGAFLLDDGGAVTLLAQSGEQGGKVLSVIAHALRLSSVPADPSALYAWCKGPDGEALVRLDLAAARATTVRIEGVPEGARLTALAVSRDGALLLAVIAEPGRASVYRLEGASAGHARCRRIASQEGGPIEALVTVDRSLVALREGRLEHLALEAPLSAKPDLSPKPGAGRSG